MCSSMPWATPEVYHEQRRGREDNPHARPLLEGRQAGEVVADWGYDTDKTIAYIAGTMKAIATTPPKRAGWFSAIATTPHTASSSTLAAPSSGANDPVNSP